MKEYLTWLKVNILESRTALFAFIALVLGSLAWVFFVPKDLPSWVALGSFYSVIFGWLTAINKKGDEIEAKVEIAKIEAGEK